MSPVELAPATEPQMWQQVMWSILRVAVNEIVLSVGVERGMPLHLGRVGVVTDIEPTAFDSEAGQADWPEAHELRGLMTDYVPRRVHAILIGNAATVQIGKISFNFPVD